MKKKLIPRDRPTDFPTLAMDRFNPIVSDDSPVLYHRLHGAQHIETPHKHDFFIMLYVEKGTGTHTVDFIDYPLDEDQLHLVFPNQVHQWDFANDTQVDQLMFSRNLFEQISPWFRVPIFHQQQRAVYTIPPTLATLIKQEFQAIKGELAVKPTYWELVYLRCQVIGLLISKLIESEKEYSEPQQIHPLLTKFIQLVEKNYRAERSVSFYADRLYISANYLNVLCKKNTASSASKIIQDRILLEAKRLLKISDRTAKEIAYDLGFYDHASFSKFFKSQTGISPSDFKRQT